MYRYNVPIKSISVLNSEVWNLLHIYFVQNIDSLIHHGEQRTKRQTRLSLIPGRTPASLVNRLWLVQVPQNWGVNAVMYLQPSCSVLLWWRPIATVNMNIICCCLFYWERCPILMLMIPGVPLETSTISIRENVLNLQHVMIPCTLPSILLQNIPEERQSLDPAEIQ